MNTELLFAAIAKANDAVTQANSELKEAAERFCPVGSLISWQIRRGGRSYPQEGSVVQIRVWHGVLTLYVQNDRTGKQAEVSPSYNQVHVIAANIDPRPYNAPDYPKRGYGSSPYSGGF